MDNRTQHFSGELSKLLTQREAFPDLAPGLVMSTFRSRPVWGGMTWRQAFPGRANQSAPARRMVGRMLADTGRRHDAEWVTAELVANALRHSCSGQARGFFVVEVLRGAGVARIVVYDLGGGSVPDFSRTSGSVLELAEHGRGLAGVAELAVRCGVAGNASTGHAVWVELAFPEEAIVVTAGAEVGDAAGGDVEESEPGGWHEAMLVASRTATEQAARVVARSGSSPVGCGASVEELDGRMGGPPVSASRPSNAPSPDQREGGCWSGPLQALVGDALGWATSQLSAFGQEPWARQALAGLREDWPGWAFLVVRCRWIAMSGKQAVISAAGPQELRQALLSIPAGPNASGLSPGSGSAWTADTGGGGVSGGVGTGLSGTVATVAPLPVALAAERSGTGTWAVAAADGARVGWRSLWPWAKRRDRSCSAAHVRKQDRLAGRDEPVRGRGHRRVRSKPAAAALAAAVAA
ncbi:ATP-binding protein [Nonomuraea sp. 10N515B]|uniref:ATP-binding protein n=1 Tax=Nonomuraea sp. 10N515B TaxID=3457422 RepID=UPI003FCD884E